MNENFWYIPPDTRYQDRRTLRIVVEREGYQWNEDWDCAEHRAVAQRELKITLTAEQEVHHINHVKKDNRPENLIVLFSIAHTIVHTLTLFAPRNIPAFSDLRNPEKLIAMLDAAHIWYEYVGRAK